VLAAKVTHVPSMMICEMPGTHHGRRDAAIDGHRELGRRMRTLGALGWDRYRGKIEIITPSTSAARAPAR